MLDIQFIRNNPDFVQQKSDQKNKKINIADFLKIDKKHKSLIQELEDLRGKRNKLTSKIKGKPTIEEIDLGAKLKKQISNTEIEFDPIDKLFKNTLKSIPNMPTDDVPIGSSEDDNKITKYFGDKKNFDFNPKTHWEIAEALGLMDRQRAAKISGSRFTYLMGGLVEMQFALINLVFKLLGDETFIQKIIKDNKLNLIAKPFVPILPPMMMKTEPYEATGRLKAEDTTYKLADDDLWLIASAEHSLCSMYANEIISEKDLPIRYIGYSTAFRREAGTYGKDTNGLIRMHHFDKLEIEIFSTSETSMDEHLLAIAIQEELTKLLELPYRVVLKCTADIGDPNARGVDIETWMPGQNCYKETHSADYMTDYQARSLKTRVKRISDNRIELVHTNDATALAMSRTLAAIIENYQTRDGRIVIPNVLRPFMNNKEQI
ncbi:MAG TPA: serine--tRNA ligase [Candidatus Dormibacteraeota bacterium]|nr:serine--tRNA ligase [Candidatus Dormibacteraeota bacterium]